MKHVLKQDSYYYCVFCSHHKHLKGPEVNLWQGHCTTFSFPVCSVNFFVHIYLGFHKTFWSFWRSVKVLTLRKTLFSTRELTEKAADKSHDVNESTCSTGHHSQANYAIAPTKLNSKILTPNSACETE